SREPRSAEAVSGAYTLVVGHPYVDVREAVKPSSVGITAWPRIPRGQDWKKGVCRALGWPREHGAARQRIPGSGAVLQGSGAGLLGRAEKLIDFVTADHAA